jgi:hypothetical protein
MAGLVPAISVRDRREKPGDADGEYVELIGTRSQREF